ncbi:MAG: SRPBCC family protein [Leptolyngbyaceae cyanobacterium bins.59]|nr:SRPBCC family protein [Leptolyngbyaceae cyanobacterium bins.59]
MLKFLSQRFIRRKKRRLQHSLVRTYQAISNASVDDLWHKIIDLADVSWHPLLTSTNVPRGLVIKPGLIYQAMTRFLPMPVHIFVELVHPQELLTVRVITLPGLEERVTYRVESTVCGTCISYSITLTGLLSPIAWSLMRPYAARVASELAQAAEQATLRAVTGEPKPRWDCFDF